MDRLKPCPFCGSKDIKLCGNHRDSFWFRCNKCASIDSYDTERQAVRAWNKRVAMPSAEPYKGMTNGEVIKAMFGDDKVSEFMGYARIMARVGNWFNDGVVAEFDKDWWNSPYEPQESEDKE